MLPSGLSFSPPASQSCLNALFYLVYSSFWNLIPFSLTARPVSTLDGLHLIKFCSFLSSFRMGLTSPGRAFGQSFLLLISRKLLTLSGLPPCFARWTQSFFSDRRACVVYQITKAAPFESVEVFRKNPFLALYFSLCSSMIFRLLCFLPLAALFTLTIWPFGPPPPQSPLRRRPHKKLCFNRIAGLNTGVFLSIRANVRPAFTQ